MVVTIAYYMRGSRIRRVPIKKKKKNRAVQETIKKLKGDQKFEVVSPTNERSYFELVTELKF